MNCSATKSPNVYRIELFVRCCRRWSELPQTCNCLRLLSQNSFEDVELPVQVESRVSGQKTPRQKPPDKNPLDKNPPCQKTPGQKPPRQNILFRNFITFVFRMSYGKEISNLVFSSKIHKAGVYKVVHGWHNLMVGWWFLKEPFWVA